MDHIFIIMIKLYIFYGKFLWKNQIFTYLLDITAIFNLIGFIGVMQIVRTQSDLSANFSNNPRIYRYFHTQPQESFELNFQVDTEH